MKILLVPLNCEMIMVLSFMLVNGFFFLSLSPLRSRKSNKEKQQITEAKNKANNINSDNCTRSNSEKSNIAVAISEKLTIWYPHIFGHFGGTNNILGDCNEQIYHIQYLYPTSYHICYITSFYIYTVPYILYIFKHTSEG